MALTLMVCPFYHTSLGEQCQQHLHATIAKLKILSNGKNLAFHADMDPAR